MLPIDTSEEDGFPRRIAGGLALWWHRRGTAVLIAASASMVLPAALWLGYEFWRLVFQSGGMAAVDLKLRLWETQGFFAGDAIYRDYSDAVYPPASYLMLWPLLGWMEVPAARRMWAVLTAIALAVLVRALVRGSGASTRAEQAFVALVPLTTYATGASVGNGQLSIAVLICLVVSLPRLGSREPGWGRDTLVAVLVLLALAKPSMSVFFFWIVVFAPGGLRPAALVCGAYAALTAAASLFQERNALQLFVDWLDRGVRGTVWGATRGEGSIAVTEGGSLRILSVNLHSLLGALGLQELFAAASLTALGLLGVWCWRHRRESVWISMGVAALVTRLCAYHGWYDDVLLLLPLVALFRIAKLATSAPVTVRVASGVLLGAMVASLLAPGGAYTLPHPWNNVYVIGQSVVWLAVLVFLIGLARRSVRSPSASAAR